MLLLGLCVSACSKKKQDDDDLAKLFPPSTAIPLPPIPEKKEEPPKYFYAFGQKRDPFTPLIGVSAALAGNSSRGLETGDIANLTLKGIIRDRKGKAALIASSDGEAYILRSGRIYDKKNRVVSGVSGIIKDTSVVLITQNRTVRELPLYKTNELGTMSQDGRNDRN